TGHACKHFPHLIHGSTSLGLASSSVRTIIPEVALLIGVSKVYCANPVIGPPAIIFPGFPTKPPHCSINSRIGVPILTIRFFGSFIPCPVTVTHLSYKGFPSNKASLTANAVLTLLTMDCASLQRPPRGTFLPVMASTILYESP